VELVAGHLLVAQGYTASSSQIASSGLIWGSPGPGWDTGSGTDLKNSFI
jgi:hypothetical protein